MLSEVLQQAAQKYMLRNDGNSVEELAERHVDEELEFYEAALQDKMKFSVVFNSLKEDGTLEYKGGSSRVRIILPPVKSSRGSLTFANRLNRAYNVVVSGITMGQNGEQIVTVKLATNFSEDDRKDVIVALKNILSDFSNYILENYKERIETEKEEAFNKFCATLDPEKNSEQIDRTLRITEESAVSEILEELISDALKKQQKGEQLTQQEQELTELVLPAKVFATRPKGRDTIKAAVDIVGMHITGTISPKFWMDRYTDAEVYRNELNILHGKIMKVAVIGYVKATDEFVCSRRILQASIWDDIEHYFEVGDIVQIRCIRTDEGAFYGRIVGEVRKNGSDEERVVSEFQGVNICCQYPNTKRALNNNLKIKVGGIYLGKIRSIDKKNHKIMARPFLEGGSWQ